jgi:hypothetical protein
VRILCPNPSAVNGTEQRELVTDMHGQAPFSGCAPVRIVVQVVGAPGFLHTPTDVAARMFEFTTQPAHFGWTYYTYHTNRHWTLVEGLLYECHADDPGGCPGPFDYGPLRRLQR